jgi:hypothetical protein
MFEFSCLGGRVYQLEAGSTVPADEPQPQRSSRMILPPPILRWQCGNNVSVDKVSSYIIYYPIRPTQYLLKVQAALSN